MNIIIIGPQASGKGTQAAKLAAHYGIFHFSTGDALRAEVKSGSELGRELSEVMNAGKLVSDELIFDIVKKAYREHPGGILLDGYPRTVAQAELVRADLAVDAVVEIVIEDETAVARISSRFMCSECGAGYNTVSLPPKTPGICDKDGAKLIQRDDDRPEAVRKRLALYHEQTAPVIGFYGKIGVAVHRIDGEQAIEEVFQDIVGTLG
ncbi:nucleoside monophosphate kinase [bacterium]|nr:nucleoside monophosphate kinase [bacterium]MBU1073847.1 nucleoside monophosphate kinase [bacterium]MBU1674497.1 nucleoside monophosphate kinase [bacterium]